MNAFIFEISLLISDMRDQFFVNTRTNISQVDRELRHVNLLSGQSDAIESVFREAVDPIRRPAVLTQFQSRR
ncbi:hypothetical protein [Paraburkholderia sp. BR14374]|uniref:hypothetical protein n=1 Tax=unclassified Paraburkholderia TaxID=2615204 RepID=UPI0034CD6108